MIELTGEDYDRYEEQLHRWDMMEVAAMSAKLSKLNQKEILCLAKHYKIPYPDDYKEGWAKFGKTELCNEIAQIMFDQGEGI